MPSGQKNYLRRENSPESLFVSTCLLWVTGIGIPASAASGSSGEPSSGSSTLTWLSVTMSPAAETHMIELITAHFIYRSWQIVNSDKDIIATNRLLSHLSYCHVFPDYLYMHEHEEEHSSERTSQPALYRWKLLDIRSPVLHGWRGKRQNGFCCFLLHWTLPCSHNTTG